MELKLDSNNFIYNSAKNGGALYLSNKKDSSVSEKRAINILNNIFKYNIADNFGGAIYSEYDQMYLAVINNNTISYNEAGITGGGLYTPSAVDKNLFDPKLIDIGNNTVNSYNNDYSTKPSYIVLDIILNQKVVDIITGEYLQLKFILYDEYDNIMEDITKYYSSISLKVKNNNISNNKDIKIKLLGNVCSFVNGKRK